MRRNKKNRDNISFERFGASVTPIVTTDNSPLSSPKFAPKIKEKERGITSNDISAASEVQMEVMNKDLKTIKERMRRILKYNHAPIFADIHVLNELNDTDAPFRAFSYDCVQYFKAVKNIERSGQKNKIVGIASLKSSSFTFFNCWKKICNIFEIIDRDGIESLKKYIHGKFESITLVISDVVRQDRRIANKDDLVVTKNNLNNLIDGLIKNIDGLLDQRELIHQKPNLADSVIHDIKTFTQIYKTAHYQEFSKVNIMQSQHSLYLSIVLTALNDIIVGINSAFAWDNDFPPILQDIEKITNGIKEVIKIIELPPSIVRPLKNVAPQQSPTSIISRARKDPLSEVKDFTNDFSGNGSFGVAQLEKFIEDICSTMKIQKKTDGDVWARLEDVRQNVLRVIQEKDNMQNEFSTFQDRIKNQSRTITNIMKEQIKMEAEKANFESEITVRNEYLEERNEELLRQINETLTVAKRREEQLFQLRATDTDGRIKRALKTVVARMNEMLDESERDFTFSDEDLVSRAERLSNFILKRRCPKCRDRELAEEELATRMSYIITDNFSSISEGVDILMKDRSRLTRENAVLQRDNKEKTELINQMKVATSDLKERIRELSIQIGQPIDADNDNIAAATLYAINMMESRQKEETDKKIKSLQEEHNKTLMKIAKAMNTDIAIPENIIKSVTVLYEEAKTLEKSTEEKDKLLKSVQDWLVDFGDFKEPKPIMDMINEIDKRENPLTKLFMDVSEESKTVQETMAIGAQRLEGIAQSGKYSKFSGMSVKTLITAFNDLIDIVHDRFEKWKVDLNTFKDNELKTSNVILGLCGRIDAFLNNNLKDRANYSIVQLLAELEKLVERALTDESPFFISTTKVNRYLEPIKGKIGTSSTDPDVVFPRVVQIIQQTIN